MKLPNCNDMRHGISTFGILYSVLIPDLKMDLVEVEKEQKGANHND